MKTFVQDHIYPQKESEKSSDAWLRLHHRKRALRVIFSVQSDSKLNFRSFWSKKRALNECIVELWIARKKFLEGGGTWTKYAITSLRWYLSAGTNGKVIRLVVKILQSKNLKNIDFATWPFAIARDRARSRTKNAKNFNNLFRAQ